MLTARERKDPHFWGPGMPRFEGTEGGGGSPGCLHSSLSVLKFVGPEYGVWETSRKWTVPRGAQRRKKKDFSLFSSSGNPEGWRDVPTGVWGNSPRETVQSAASCLSKEGMLMTFLLLLFLGQSFQTGVLGPCHLMQRLGGGGRPFIWVTLNNSTQLQCRPHLTDDVSWAEVTFSWAQPVLNTHLSCQGGSASPDAR